MNVIIDGKTYKGSGGMTDNRFSVIIVAEISDAFAWDKEMTVTVDNEEYNVSSLRSIGRYDEQIRVEWECETEAARLERELSKSNTALERIREALSALGSGVPTLSKLTDFLSAVREAMQ